MRHGHRDQQQPDGNHRRTDEETSTGSLCQLTTRSQRYDDRRDDCAREDSADDEQKLMDPE